MSCCNFGNRSSNYPRRHDRFSPSFDFRRDCGRFDCRRSRPRRSGFCSRRGGTCSGFGRLF